MAIQEKEIPDSIRQEVLGAARKRMNIGGGFTLPISQEDQAFIRDNRNSEHFRVFFRMIDVYSDYAKGRVMGCPLEEVMQYRGQLQALAGLKTILGFATNGEK